MRPLTIFLSSLLAISLAACQSGQPFGGAPSAASISRLQAILASGELRVGTSADLPPLTMKNKRGEITGFEAELVEALAEAMNLKVRFVVKPFSELLSTLERGEVDLVISGLTITAERNARVAFAGPYFISGTSIVAKSEAITDVQSTELLDDPSLTFAALEGSTSARFVNESLPRARLVIVQDYEAAVRKVIDDEVDGLVADYLACKLAVWRNSDAGLSAMMTPFTIEPLGIALPADDPLLLNLVQNYLNTLENTGLLTRFKAKWLSDGSWLAELP